MSNSNRNLIPIAIIVAALIIGGIFFYINRQGKEEGILSPQAAAQRAIDFINQNKEGFRLAEDMNVSLVDVVEESGIYKIRLKIGDQEFPSYVTKDGKLLFPQEGINLDEKIPVAEEPAGRTPPPIDMPEEKLVALAKCLSEKGVKFYGTHWCPACTAQKEMFGEAAKYLPYIECASDRASPQELAMCEEANVRSIPDWRFPDGRQEPGMLSLERLTELSGCQL